MQNDYEQIYYKLFDYFGPQQWWPAETKLEIIIGAILVQNTTWHNASKAITNLKPVLQLDKLIAMPLDQLAQLIRPSGFYNLKAARIANFLNWFQQYEFNFSKLAYFDTDQLRQKLLSVNGIGRETADVILLYVFERPAFIADAYARRLITRLGKNVPKGYDNFKKVVEENVNLTVQQYNEFHALIIVQGQTFCKATPQCNCCPLATLCLQKKKQLVTLHESVNYSPKPFSKKEGQSLCFYQLERLGRSYNNK